MTSRHFDQLEGVFYARFDDVAGTVVECQVGSCSQSHECGKLALTSDLWDRVSDFIIVRKELCGKVLTISDADDSGKLVLGFPQYIEDDTRYSRNTFFFSFGFVFHIGHPKDEHAFFGSGVSGYDNVLRKLSGFMATMEMESRYLSSEGAKDRLAPVLESILRQLWEHGECIVKIDPYSTLGLKLIPRLIDPPEVLDHQIPVPTCEIAELCSREWDITILRILPFINGQYHIKLIAELSDVSVAIVRRCVRQLLYYRCIKIADIFQYSNIYVCTSRVVDLAENEELQRKCIQYVWTDQGEQPPVTKIFQFYTALQPNLCLKDFLLMHDLMAHNIDDRRFIVFGILHQLIRRVHEYPVLACMVSEGDVREPNDCSQKAFCAKVEDCFTLGKIKKRNGRTENADTKSSTRETDDASDLSDSDDSLKPVTGRFGSREGLALSSPNYKPSTKPETQNHVNEYLRSLLCGRNSIDSICSELWCSREKIIMQLRKSNAHSGQARAIVLQK